MKKILLIGSYGRGNLGDDAFIYSAIKLFPNCEIYINSANDDLLPADIRAQVKTIHTTGLRDLFVKIRTIFNNRQFVRVRRTKPVHNFLTYTQIVMFIIRN